MVSAGVSAAESPVVVNGIADLRSWDKARIVRLSGEYEFYWQQHLTPRELLLITESEPALESVPGTWEEGSGFATYRVNLLVPNVDSYALKLPDVGTAYRLFLDGELIFSAGDPGTTADSTVPKYFPTTIEFVPRSPRIEIVFHVSNFHYRIGGIWLPVLFVPLIKLKDTLNANRRWTCYFLAQSSSLVSTIWHCLAYVVKIPLPSISVFSVSCSQHA